MSSNIDPTLLYPQAQRTIGSATDGAAANAIKNKILSDFYHHGGVSELLDNGKVHNPLFDEPTYLTFRVEFIFENPSGIDSLNDMPMPLLNQVDDPDKSKLNYSTYDYLIEQKESGRADLLKSFIARLKSVQHNYPYYFKSVEGIGNLLKVTPATGRRLKEGENILTFKCYEGLDLKITELLNIYRKVAWDDVYQRWMLPDMMRYFQMKIYISEIRNFHTTSASYSQTNNVFDTGSSGGSLPNNNTWWSKVKKVSSVVSKIESIVNKVSSTINSFMPQTTAERFTLINNGINLVMPTLCITCKQCEFVLDDTMSHFGTFTSSNKSAVDDVQIKIKVGNIMESQTYPLDFKYNITDLGERTATLLLDEALYRTSQYGSTEVEKKYLQGDTNRRNYFTPDVSSSYTVFDETSGKSWIMSSVIGDIIKNATRTVAGAADNIAGDVLNRILINPLGNTTNTSIQGALNALDSRNILSMYSYVRSAINDTVNGGGAVHEDMLNPDIDSSVKKTQIHNTEIGDEQFKAVLKEIGNLPTSGATDEEKKIIEIAGVIKDADLDSRDLDALFKEFENKKSEGVTHNSEEVKKLMEYEAKIIKNSIEKYDTGETIPNRTLYDRTPAMDYSGLPDSEAVENFTKTNDILRVSEPRTIKSDTIGTPGDIGESDYHNDSIIRSEFDDLISDLRKLSLSSATDPGTKIKSLSVYNELKKLIDDDTEGKSADKVISDILDKEDLNPDARKTITKFVIESSKSNNLKNVIQNMVDLKDDVIDNSHENVQETEIEGFSDLKVDLPESNVINGDLLNPLVDTSESYEQYVETQKKITGFEDAGSGLKLKSEIAPKIETNLPDSEAVENWFQTNQMAPKPALNENPKTDSITGFEDLKNQTANKEKTITIDPPQDASIFEAVLNNYDEMSAEKRKKLNSEFPKR